MGSPPPSSPDPVVIAQPASEVEAAILKGALEAEGIPSWVLGGLTSGFRAEAPGRTKLMVRAVDADRARRVIGQADRPTEESGPD